MQWNRIQFCVVIACICGMVLGALAGGGADAQATVDRVTLECGLEVVVYSEQGMKGGTQVVARLHRGSMSELDSERGAAMMASRAAMYGIGGYSHERMLGLMGIDESVSDSWAAAGLGPMVTRDHVAFMLGNDGDDARDDELIRDGMMLANALVSGFAPSDEVIESVREGMLAEIDSIDSDQVERSMSRRWLPELMDGSGFSRGPLVTREECERLSNDAVRGYVARSWNAGQASVLVVGDVDAAEVIAEARRVFDGCESGEATVGCVVPVLKTDLGGRVVVMHEPKMEGSLVGLVWFGDESRRVWNERDYRDMLELALCGEAMRYRLNRLMRRDCEGVEIARVEVGDLMGRYRFGQMIAELAEDDDGGKEGGAWESALAGLEIERRRMIRDGLSVFEIERAREWVLQQWEYETDQWRGATTRERARTLSWMMSMGRPLKDLLKWEHHGEEWLDAIDVDRVNEVIRENFGDQDPAVLVLLDSDEGVDESVVNDVLSRARGTAPEVLASDWIKDLQGPILNRSGSGGEVDEISVHQASGTVSATLSNGVVVHHREMVDTENPGHVSMVVRIGFDSIEDASMSGAGDVLAAAIERGTIQSRTERELRGILVEHGIEVGVSRGVWGIEIQVSVPAESFELGAEFVHAVLTDLRIEGGLIAEVSGEGASGARSLGVPVDSMEVGIGRVFGVGFTIRDPRGLGAGVDARSARDWIARQVQGKHIEVGIAGEIDAEEAIQVCARQLGGIDSGKGSSREVPRVESVGVGPKVVRVLAEGGREGVMVGFGACDVDDLEGFRALTVAGLVLDDRIKARVVEMGEMGEDHWVLSGAMTVDLVPGRVVMFARVECDPSEIEEWADVLASVIESMAIEGVSDGELDEPMSVIDSMLSKGIDRTGFWSGRLARLGLRHGGVEAVWSIGESYRSLDAARVGEIFGKWYREGDHFRLEMVGGER